MWRKLPIEPNEWRLVGWAGAVLVLAGWADVSVQNAAETLFLKRVGVEYLPLAFLVSSLLLVGTTAGMVRLASNRDRTELLTRVFAALALVLIPVWGAVRFDTPGSLALLVLLSIQIKAIALVVFWVAMGDLLHARQAKRLFAPLMAGLTLGAMFGSFLSKPIGMALGIDGLLPFSSVLLVAAAFLSLPLRQLKPARLDRGLGEDARRMPTPVVPLPASPERVATLRELWDESRLFRLLLVSATASGVLGTLLYLEFQLVADQSTGGAEGEEQLLGLYAQLRGWVNALVLLAQIAMSSRIYARVGLPVAAAFSPVIYLLGFAGLGVHLSLPVAISAMAAVRVQDHAIYDPAQRILYNLFPESLRSRATGLLEGPVKRMGSALGNVVFMLAAAVGSLAWVAPLGVAIATLWLAASLLLWRRYPSLLLEASASRVVLGESHEVADMLDRATLAQLGRELLDPNAVRVQTAIELVADGPREHAIDLLSSAARKASETTRPLLVAALDRVLEAGVTQRLHSSSAARDIQALLGAGGALDERDRADLVQAYGRLLGGDEAEAGDPVLERALDDPSAAVQLAARAALHHRGDARAGDLDRALVAAVREGDAASRRTAREEFRALLLASAADDTWLDRLRSLAELLDLEDERTETAEAIAEVSARHGPATAPVADSVLALREEPDPRLRAAVLRYAGHAGLSNQATWIVEHVASQDPRTTAAARDGLLALGPMAADALLIEHCFGKRSTRDAILSLVRELEVDTETLRDLYRRELDWIRRTLVILHAVAGRYENARAPDIVVQRLHERMDEGLHTALLFLTAIYDEDRIAELDDLLRRTQGERQHAILLEALESFLSPEEKSQLLPLFDSRSLEVRAAIAASGLRVPIPTFEEARRALIEDADDLTREIAASTPWNGDGVVADRRIGKDGEVLSPVEIALQIRAIPLFERLSTRQLLDLAAVVHQESHQPGSEVFLEGDDGSSMYFIVDGEVEVRQGDDLRTTLGPGGWFGELAVFDGVTRSASVVTRNETRLIRLERNDLLSVIEELPSIAIGICQSLSRRLREIESRP